MLMQAHAFSQQDYHDKPETYIYNLSKEDITELESAVRSVLPNLSSISDIKVGC